MKHFLNTSNQQILDEFIGTKPVVPVVITEDIKCKWCGNSFKRGSNHGPISGFCSRNCCSYYFYKKRHFIIDFWTLVEDSIPICRICGSNKTRIERSKYGGYKEHWHYFIKGYRNSGRICGTCYDKRINQKYVQEGRYRKPKQEKECMICHSKFFATEHSLRKTCLSKECRLSNKRIWSKQPSKRKTANQYSRSFRKSWGCMEVKDVSSYRLSAKRGLDIEKKALSIISSKGFYNIVHCAEFGVNFPGDYIATKDDRKCLIEVTTSTHHKIIGQKNLAKVLNLDFYMLYVKSDLSAFYLKKIDIDYMCDHICLKRSEILKSERID